MTDRRANARTKALPAPFWLRVMMAFPVIGWVLRDLLFGDKDNVWYAIIAFLSAWVSAIIMFGIPALFLVALAMVPVMFVVLIAITWA